MFFHIIVFLHRKGDWVISIMKYLAGFSNVPGTVKEVALLKIRKSYSKCLYLLCDKATKPMMLWRNIMPMLTLFFLSIFYC